LTWSKEFIQWHVDELKNGTLEGSYGKSAILKIQRHIKDYMNIKGSFFVNQLH